MSATLNIGQTIDGYQIEEFVKTSADGRVESYWAKDDAGKRALMKLYVDDKLNDVIDYTTTLEVIADQSSSLPTIKSGAITHEGVEHWYSVREYIEGQRLSELIATGKRFTWDEAKPIILRLLMTLKLLHTQNPVLLHNDITARNIIVRGLDEGVISMYLIGFGHLSHRCNGKATFCTNDLNNWYRAPETFKGMYDEQSDIFSVGALFHTMLVGFEPWGAAADALGPDVNKNQLKHIRSVGDEILDDMELTDEQRTILGKMIALDYDNRYRNVDDAIKDLMRGSVREHTTRREHGDGYKLETKEEDYIKKDAIEPRTGGGFADVVGMADVKRMLYKDVMFIMQNKEKAERYRLKAPNGALFYGPPGCGKTYIAEKFAEESHLNFMMVKASDLGSIYIHGTQGKIAELFEQAAQKAPTVICFDELDGMAPDRSTIHNEGASGEVNEFLSQLNNCSERGIFVIGTSNRPDKIDSAILRTGRLDKMVYIPMPDEDTRKELFRLHLDGRYCDESIDVEKLAEQSEGFVASDISFIVNESALEAAMADVPISQALVLAEMQKARRSVSKEDAKEYEQMSVKLEQKNQGRERRRIGF